MVTATCATTLIETPEKGNTVVLSKNIVPFAIAAFAPLPAGCAPQPTTPMQSAMQPMGMSELMAHREEMKQQMQPGVTITADMSRCVNMLMGTRPGELDPVERLAVKTAEILVGVGR
jgi:hypothetical protein